MKTMVWVALMALAGLCTRGEDLSSTTDCTRRLQVIFEGLQAFRRVEGDYPGSLSELHPRFIADVQTLSCPVALASRNFQFGVKEFRDALANDPSTSYNYELNRGIIWKGPGAGQSLTYRDFKLLQRKTPLGDRVPIIRCCNHQEPAGCLNLSFAGRVYASPPFWEVSFREVLPHPYLIPEAVFRDTRPIRERIPSRPAGLPDELVDLTLKYNGCLHDSWIWGKAQGPLAELLTAGARGPLVLAGLRFDARGVLQVDAIPAPPGAKGFPVPMFPESIQDVALPPKARSLAFLLGTVFSAEPATPIGTIRMRYRDGSGESMPIVYGVDVADSLAPGTPSVPTVWRNSGRFGHLYLKSWRNPRPDQPLASFTFSSAMTVSAPFIVAVSAQP